MTDLKQNSYTLILNDAALAVHIEQWLKQPVIAIDTEFVRESTFYAIPGLIQVADSLGVYLIDPLQVADLSLLGPILVDQRVVKIMHSMSEDIELLHYATGIYPQSIFDTQTAAGLLGYGASLSYQNLVAQVLGYELDKTETRSDWLQRPLSERQLEYAAKDAEFLLQLYHQLQPRLVERGLAEVVLSESQFAIEQSKDALAHPELAYLKLRGGADLSLAQQGLLKQLVLWREHIARARNVPRAWVFADALLIQIARRPPSDIKELKRLDGVKSKSIHLYGEELINLLKRYEPESEQSFIEIEKPIRGDEQHLYKALKQVVERVAEATGIASQLLGSRKMLERIVIAVTRQNVFELPEEFLGWRKDLVGDKLMLVVQKFGLEQS